MEEETFLNSVKDFVTRLSRPPVQEDFDARAELELVNSTTYLDRVGRESQQGAVFEVLSECNNEIRSKEGESSIMVAVRDGNDKLVEELIKNGANVDCEDKYYNTPLLLAVLCSHERIVELLLKNGASCLVENKNCETPLHAAIHLNLESIFDMLIEAGADVNIADGKNVTPIEKALTVVNLRIARKLLDNGAFLSPPSVFSSLLKCYSLNFSKLFYFILENGFDAYSKGFESWSLLHLAVLRENVTVTNHLLEMNVNVNAKDRSGETPLHFAVRISNCTIIKMLLEYKSDVNATDSLGRTPLYVAVVSLCEEITRILINAGGDLYISGVFGNSPFDSALLLKSRSPNIASYMLCARKMELANVPINLTQNDRKSPKHFTTLDAFELQCFRELDRMKAKKFGDITLYNVFSDCYDPLYAGSTDMKVYIKSGAVKIDFPVYADLLKRKFKEAVKRNTLLDELILGVKIVEGSNITNVVLPNEISRKILVNLENCDLLNLKKAFTH